MKRLVLVLTVGLCFALASTLTSCVSASSLKLEAYPTTTALKEPTVLGAATVDAKHYSYSDLFQAAQKEYPDVQEVIHIQIDKLSNGRYRMYGMAVKY